MHGSKQMDHPLDFIDFDEVIQHGDPGKWKSIGVKPGSGVPAHSPSAPPGTTKHYDIYEDEFGDEIEVHYLSSPGWIGQRCQGEAPKLGGAYADDSNKRSLAPPAGRQL
jgi:hypothetical protein